MQGSANGNGLQFENHPERAAEIRAAVNAFGVERERYASTPGDAPPGPKIFGLAASIVMAFASGAIPKQFLGCLRAIEGLAEHLVRLFTGVDSNGRRYDLNTQIPSDVIWSCHDRLVKLIDFKPTIPRIEPLADLFTQEVGDDQIAKIHGLERHVVSAYRENPDSIPKGYEPPALKKLVAEQYDQLTQTDSNGMMLSVLASKLEAAGICRHGNFDESDEASVEYATV